MCLGLGLGEREGHNVVPFFPPQKYSLSLRHLQQPPFPLTKCKKSDDNFGFCGEPRTRFAPRIAGAESRCCVFALRARARRGARRPARGATADKTRTRSRTPPLTPPTPPNCGKQVQYNPSQQFDQHATVNRERHTTNTIPRILKHASLVVSQTTRLPCRGHGERPHDLV